MPNHSRRKTNRLRQSNQNRRDHSFKNSAGKTQAEPERNWYRTFEKETRQSRRSAAGESAHG